MAADQQKDIVVGDGYAVADIDSVGEGYGFRKIRRALGVTAFGINAIVLPPGAETGRRDRALGSRACRRFAGARGLPQLNKFTNVDSLPRR